MCSASTLLREISLGYHGGFFQLVGPDFLLENQHLVESGFASHFFRGEDGRVYLRPILVDHYLGVEMLAQTFLTFLAWIPPQPSAGWRSRRNVALAHMNDILSRHRVPLAASILDEDVLLITRLNPEVPTSEYVACLKKSLLASC